MATTVDERVSLYFSKGGPMTGRDRILAVLEGTAADSLPLMPITMMLAADQIGVPYGKYAADYRMLVEGQIRTAEAFDFDHVSCVSDPAREAADCGAAVQYFDHQPPAVDETRSLLADKDVLHRLKAPDPLGGGRMHDRIEAVALFRRRVGGRKLIEGWIEGPCAEAADLRGINRLMTDFYDDPAFVRDLFDFTLALGLEFARAQVEAGADLIGVGDAAASLVGPRIYDEFVLPYERKLVDGLHAMGTRVRLHICGNIRRILPGVGSLGCDLVDVDSMVPLDQARREMGSATVLAGNLDPVKTLRNGTPEGITAALAECRRQAGPRYIVAAGCEVPRDTPEANVRALAAYARAHRP
jgi:MtaA/CmuA family methyltransferase